VGVCASQPRSGPRTEVQCPSDLPLPGAKPGPQRPRHAPPTPLRPGSLGALGYGVHCTTDDESEEDREYQADQEFYGNAGGESDVLDPTHLTLGYQACVEMPGKVRRPRVAPPLCNARRQQPLQCGLLKCKFPPFSRCPFDLIPTWCQEEEVTAAVVTCGNSHTACITRRGMLYTFGLGSNGELGLGASSANLVGQVEDGRVPRAMWH
jgi:hypothetical protein